MHLAFSKKNLRKVTMRCEPKTRQLAEPVKESCTFPVEPVKFVLTVEMCLGTELVCFEGSQTIS